MPAKSAQASSLFHSFAWETAGSGSDRRDYGRSHPRQESFHFWPRIGFINA
jgi:hypothetical protein